MAPSERFARDLYAGSATDYDRFRLPYPQALIGNLMSHVAHHERLVDLACGTGQLALALAPQFTIVDAVDREPDMIAVVRRRAQRDGSAHVNPIVGDAETVVIAPASVDLITIGNAFHRLDRDEVARRAFDWLRPGGCLALVWSNMPWVGVARWQRTLDATLHTWIDRLDATSRVSADAGDDRRSRPDATVLRSVGFEVEEVRQFPTDHTWTVDELIGLTYSTSFLPRSVVGRRRADFEFDVRSQLARAEPGGEFHETVDAAYQLATKPA